MVQLTAETGPVDYPRQIDLKNCMLQFALYIITLNSATVDTPTYSLLTVPGSGANCPDLSYLDSADIGNSANGKEGFICSPRHVLAIEPMTSTTVCSKYTELWNNYYTI